MIKQLTESYIPESIAGPVLLDQNWMPRYWAAVWSTMFAGQLANSTHKKKLYFIDGLYRHADDLYGLGALDDCLANLDDVRIAECLESWFISISNKTNRTDSDEARWQAGLEFVTSVVSWIAKSGADGRLRNIEKRLHRLSLLYKQLNRLE